MLKYFEYSLIDLDSSASYNDARKQKGKHKQAENIVINVYSHICIGIKRNSIMRLIFNRFKIKMILTCPEIIDIPSAICIVNRHALQHISLCFIPLYLFIYLFHIICYHSLTVTHTNRATEKKKIYMHFMVCECVFIAITSI